MSADKPIFFSYSNDGRVAHVDTRRVPVYPLSRFVAILTGASESGFEITCQSADGVVLIDNQQLEADPTDPEADALFLEHIVMDELALADYATIERTNEYPQELLPGPEC